MPRDIAFYRGHDTQVLVNEHPLRRIAFFQPDQPWNWSTSDGRLDLSLSILAHHFNDRRLTAERMQQLTAQTGEEMTAPVTLIYFRAFAKEVISTWGSTWDYTTNDIVCWLIAHHKQRRKE